MGSNILASVAQTQGVNTMHDTHQDRRDEALVGEVIIRLARKIATQETVQFCTSLEQTITQKLCDTYDRINQLAVENKEQKNEINELKNELLRVKRQQLDWNERLHIIEKDINKLNERQDSVIQKELISKR